MSFWVQGRRCGLQLICHRAWKKQTMIGCLDGRLRPLACVCRRVECGGDNGQKKWITSLRIQSETCLQELRKCKSQQPKWCLLVAVLAPMPPGTKLEMPLWPVMSRGLLRGGEAVCCLSAPSPPRMPSQASQPHISLSLISFGSLFTIGVCCIPNKMNWIITVQYFIHSETKTGA